jgi:hypothetical protein
MALETLVVAVTLSLGFALAARRGLDRWGWPAWVGLAALHRQAVGAMRESLRGRVQLVQVTLAGVEHAHHAGDRGEAGELLRLSLARLEEFVRDVSRRLAEWAASARALAALQPLPPLGLRDVRLGRLRVLVVVWGLLHLVAVTSAERFRLRVGVLRRALTTLLEFWRAVRLPATARTTWRAPSHVSHDVQALAEAAGDTYEALVVSRLSDETRRRLPAHDAREAHPPE